MSTLHHLSQQPIVLNSSDTFVALIDGRHVDTLEDFYEQIARALQLPDYFGENLDALDEMLYDLEWIDHDYVLLIITHSDEFLDTEHETRQSILQLFEEIDNPYFDVCLIQ